MSLSIYLITITALIVLAWVANNKLGFMGQTPDNYAIDAAPFDIREALDGKILCEGIIYGPLGRVNARFIAEMNAKWIGRKGTITEEFQYDSGTTQRRTWYLEMLEGGKFNASASDIIGVGQGTQNGSAVQLFYRLELPQDAGGHQLNVTDWMYMLENGTIMNRSQMRKFGLKVGELVATMRKVKP